MGQRDLFRTTLEYASANVHPQRWWKRELIPKVLRDQDIKWAIYILFRAIKLPTTTHTPNSSGLILSFIPSAHTRQVLVISIKKTLHSFAVTISFLPIR